MALVETMQLDRMVKVPDTRLLQNIKDYTAVSLSLLWQRQAIFFATTLLTAFYFDPINAAIFYCTILFCELQDIMIAHKVANLQVNQKRAIRSSLIWILLNTLLSSSAICLYAVSVALKQDVGDHFTPIFFLFAAALFAAMNNHQLVMALALRLVMYGLSFLIIVFADIWIVRPSLDSNLWLHFFTIIFVMYFLTDCSIIFLKLYRKNLAQLEALKQEHERTKAAYIIKSQFISTVSHELRTPLTSIKGSLDLLNSGVMGEPPEKMEKLLDMAGRNAARLSVLIDDVLDLQKIEAGEMEYRMDVLHVPALIEEAVNSNAGYAAAHNVTIEHLNTEDPTMLIEGDETRLMQVMANMISNAAKFSSTGGMVTVGCKHHAGKVRIFVRDSGCGIPAGSEDKVFGRFNQIDSSDQRRASGSGLGMNISKEIVEHHNGTISYESQLGSGTTFYTDFPAFKGPF